MTESILIAIIGLAGVIIGGAISIIGNALGKSAERKNYIVKTRFDKEFEIYQELSEKTLNMVYKAVSTTRIIEKSNGEYTPDLFDDQMEMYSNSINDANYTAMKYAPFMNKKMANQFRELINECKVLFEMMKYLLVKTSPEITITNKNKTIQIDKSTALPAIKNKSQEIMKSSENILDDLRKTINKY